MFFWRRKKLNGLVCNSSQTASWPVLVNAVCMSSICLCYVFGMSSGCRWYVFDLPSVRLLYVFSMSGVCLLLNYLYCEKLIIITHLGDNYIKLIKFDWLISFRLIKTKYWNIWRPLLYLKDNIIFALSLLFTLTISGHRAAALLLHDDVHVERWAGGGGGQGGSRGSEDAR